jgi:hypothetical protein
LPQIKGNIATDVKIYVIGNITEIKDNGCQGVIDYWVKNATDSKSNRIRVATD